jgi:hypothetical protein
MATTSAREENDGFVRGFYGIPDDGKLNAMSFTELCELLASCEKESPKFLVVEREMKRRLAKDQAKIDRVNILLGALIGGAFTLVGAVGGAFIQSLPATGPAVQSSISQPGEKPYLPQTPPAKAPDAPRASPSEKKDAQPAGAKP